MLNYELQMKSEKLDDMKQIEVLQGYLQSLYEAYDVFQTDYKRLHKRSKMHNYETVSEYYLRWRDSMRNEIQRIEMILIKRLPKSKLKVETADQKVEIFQLQIVA